jgi:hypothetical protein
MILDNGDRCGSTYDLKRVQMRAPWNRAKFDTRTKLICGHCRSDSVGHFRYAP